MGVKEKLPDQLARSPSGQRGGRGWPLFPKEEDEIGAALLGLDRIQEWKQIAPMLEARGLPKIDTVMGGRYWPAVRAFFDHTYGLDRGAAPPLAPDGIEDFSTWREKQKRRV